MCFAPWGGRSTQQSFIQGGSAPRSNLLLFKRGSPWALELKKKKRSRLVTTAATSWQRFWSKILLVHKVARDFLAIHKPHRSSFFFCLFVCFSFFSFCLFVCLFDFVFNCLFQEPRKRRFTNWSWCLFNNYSSSLNGLWVNSPWGHCFGFQSWRFNTARGLM